MGLQGGLSPAEFSADGRLPADPEGSRPALRQRNFVQTVDHRPGEWLRNKQTIALIEEIGTAEIPAVASREGAAGGTYVTELLVIAYAAWISPAFHVRVLTVFAGSPAWIDTGALDDAGMGCRPANQRTQPVCALAVSRSTPRAISGRKAPANA